MEIIVPVRIAVCVTHIRLTLTYISVAAFKLSALELTEGQKVEIKLKWDSYSGEKTHVFEYTPGEALSSGQEGNDPGQQSMLTIE